MFNEFPANARINVFDIVPIASFPIFIPDRNNSHLVSCGFTMWSSAMEDAILIATSITAPIHAIKIPHRKRSFIFKSVVPMMRSKFSASSIWYVVTDMNLCAITENPAPASTPHMLPIAATTVLIWIPSIKKNVTRLQIRMRTIVTRSAEYPFIVSGSKIHIIHTIVNIIPTADFAPFFPPMTINSKIKIAIAAIICGTR